MKFEMTFQDHIEATRRLAELIESGVTAKYMGLWDGLYVVEYEANAPLPARILTDATEPAPEEMQYVNRRETMPDGTRGDGALWPTMFPITSPGWVQIGAYPIDGRHERKETVLIFNGYVQPADKMDHVLFCNTSGYSVQYINFSKGDHLTAQEREAWEAEAAGY